jgi:hypothetical protein
MKMSKDNSQPVNLYITPKCHEKIIQYAHAASGEISGFARLNPSTKVIDRILPLLPQVCSDSETEMDESFLHTFIESGQSAAANVWWHSHGNLGVGWSGQDETCIKALGQTVPWLISIVVNKARDSKTRIDIFTPVRTTLEASLYFRYEYPFAEIQRLRDEVKEKVKALTFPKASTVRTVGDVVRGSESWKQKHHHFSPSAIELEELQGYGWTVKNGEVVPMTDAEKQDYLLKKVKGDNNGGNSIIQSDFGFGD